MKFIRPIYLFLTLLLTPGLQGCFFTGVESTPKITAGDVKREREPVAPEDTFLVRAADEPLSGWRPGKEFVVTDSRIALIFGATAPRDMQLAGRTITYAGATEASSVTDTPVTDLKFRSPQGDELIYRVNRPLPKLMEDASRSIPYTIQRTVVGEADRTMRGRDFYILTLAWRDDTDNPIGGGRKFVKVHIDSVSPGNSLYPLKVAFTDERGVSGRVFLHPGAKESAPKTFSTVFSFSDPYLRYPSTAPETWKLITEGKIVDGMTREECRLALGSPKEVERGATQGYLMEAWLYENGVYLLFEDGLLKRFRH